MKKFLALIFLGTISLSSFSQNWRHDFYSPSTAKGAMNFYEIQKDFNTYWSKYDLKSGFYFENGVKTKAAGWKQFKRWEWYWETRVDRRTGEFPNVNMVEVKNSAMKGYNAKADDSNWQSMGPSSSDGGYAGIGRLNCIAFHPSDVNTFWVGAPSGGLWKTTNGGTSWSVLTDNLPVIGVSEIIVPANYSTSKTLYIATGDRDGGDNYSIGVLKSTDDGATWNETGLKFNVSSKFRITRMLVHPTEQNIFYVSTNGGIYKSIDSGDSWVKVLNGIFFDMEFKHGSESTTLFAVTADYYGESKIFRTTDGGANWIEVHSFPSSVYRVELDASQSNPSIVYALSSTTSGGMEGIYKSTNGGDSFSKVFDGTISGQNLLSWHAGEASTRGQGWYDLTLSVSPIDDKVLYLGGINAWKSTDGGSTWGIANHWYGKDGVPAAHADKHYMEFQNQSTFFELNDGGLYKTTNGGTSWVDITNGMVISQIYKIGVSQTVKNEVICGLQDNGSKLSSFSNWYDVKGGDGMECIIDPVDSKIQYATYVNGQIDRTLDHWSNWRTVVDITANIPGGPSGAWVTPYMLDPNDSKTIFVGYEDVWKTTDRGDTWEKISSLNLTNKIRSMAIAPSSSKVLYITDLVNLYRSINGGETWENISSTLPVNSNAITYITIDSKNSNRVWLTLGGYGGSKVLESSNGGASWTDISQGLPSVPANTIVQNTMSVTLQLYAGTDVGVFVKEGSNDWTLFSKNLPSVIVTELEIHYDRTNPLNSVLYAATYGRGLWKSNLAAFEVPKIQLSRVPNPIFVSNDSTSVFDLGLSLNTSFTGNLFTAYLSDAQGNFTQTIAIGSLQSNSAGSIKVTIPKGTPSGSNYLIKVVSSNPAMDSELSNLFEVVLDNDAPTYTFSSEQSQSTSAGSFDVKVIFSEPVNDFNQSKISFTNATVKSFAASKSKEFTVTIAPVATGEVKVNVPAKAAYDRAGNWNIEAGEWNINFTNTSSPEFLQQGVRMFPNPTRGNITIDLGSKHQHANLAITDLLGRTVYASKVKGSVQVFDLSHLAKGIYIVKLNVDGKDLSSRLIIE